LPEQITAYQYGTATGRATAKNSAAAVHEGGKTTALESKPDALVNWGFNTNA
jgi:hypothetical protein